MQDNTLSPEDRTLGVPTVEILSQVSQADSLAIQQLLPALSSSFKNNPLDISLLQEIVASPFHTQIVARIDGRIVGIATLSTTIGPAAGRKLYLEDFVVDTSIQGKGVGGAIWQMIEKQCRDKDMPLHFNSRPARKAAHDFYIKHGATVYETTVFHWRVSKVK